MSVGELYQLPSDEAETQRLATQHLLWSLMIGGIYPAALAETIERVLQPTPDNARPSVLDIGCGSGIWSIEMALKFPQALVIGCDVNEWSSYRNAPANFKFERGDIARGVPSQLCSAQFDVIHCRCVAQHVADPQSLVNIIAGRLKPGGIVLLADGDWVAFDRHKTPLVPFVFNADLPEDAQRHQHQHQEQRSFYAGWLHLLGKITRSRRYKPVDVLLRDSGHFEDIHIKHYFTPINWPGQNVENGDKIGGIMNVNMREFFRNARAAALKHGVTPRMLDIWEEEYLKEFSQCRYNIWHYSWGRKVQ